MSRLGSGTTRAPTELRHKKRSVGILTVNDVCQTNGRGSIGLVRRNEPPPVPGGPLICVSNFHRSRHARSADWMFTADVGGPPRLRAFLLGRNWGAHGPSARWHQVDGPPFCTPNSACLGPP